MTADKLFAKAGLQPGDLITAVNDTSVDSVEAFRKVLRKHFAWEEAMTFHIQREGKALTIATPRPELHAGAKNRCPFLCSAYFI